MTTLILSSCFSFLPHSLLSFFLVCKTATHRKCEAKVRIHLTPASSERDTSLLPHCTDDFHVCFHLPCIFCIYAHFQFEWKQCQQLFSS